MTIVDYNKYTECCTCPEPLDHNSPILVLIDQMEYYVQTRTLKRLSQAGIKTVGDLIGIREDNLKKTKQLGIKSIMEIKRVLALNNMKLGTITSGLLPSVALKRQLFEWDVT